MRLLCSTRPNCYILPFLAGALILYGANQFAVCDSCNESSDGGYIVITNSMPEPPACVALNETYGFTSQVVPDTNWFFWDPPEVCKDSQPFLTYQCLYVKVDTDCGDSPGTWKYKAKQQGSIVDWNVVNQQNEICVYWKIYSYVWTDGEIDNDGYYWWSEIESPEHGPFETGCQCG